MAHLFTFILLAAIAGVIWPYLKGLKRRHFAFASVAAFIGIGATIPPPTPAELAAKKAAEQKEKAEEAREAANERAEASVAAASGVREGHDKIVAKAAAGVEVAPDYTKAEYRQTFARVGASTFAKLNELEPGAVYAAAESPDCDRVSSAAVSDTSKPKAAIWFVDCANENRFMVNQSQASDALERFKRHALARRDLEASCTLTTVSMCKATPVQRAAKAREVEFVSGCDMLLQQALTSPSSLNMQGMWNTEFGKGDTVIFRRAFDSQNGFGATIRSRYRCDVNAASGNIERFQVEGPMGVQRVI